MCCTSDPAMKRVVRAESYNKIKEKLLNLSFYLIFCINFYLVYQIKNNLIDFLSIETDLNKMNNKVIIYLVKQKVSQTKLLVYK